jgi:hypothetical protein
MGLRNQKTSFLTFERTAHGLRGDLVLHNGAKLDCMTWASKREVVDMAQTMCRANQAFGRLIISANTVNQEVIKI